MSKAKKAPLIKRPLQVGDRVSFEGYGPSGRWLEGKGTLVYVDNRGEVQLKDGSIQILGLRSFRRLVKRGRK
jgi:hypothetical protein